MRKDPGEIIKTLVANDGQVRKTARELGVSPATVINWRRRAATGSQGTRYLATNLQRRSTAPKTKRQTTLSAAEQTTATLLRQETGYSAQKLTYLLGLVCHWRTVHRHLRRKDLVRLGKTYRRPRFQETTHMYLKNALTPGKLQMDVKYVTPELSGLVHTVYLYAVMDIYTRYKQGVILPLLDSQGAITALQTMTPLLPFQPDFIQTDNGLEFQSSFHNYVTKQLLWQHHYIHKSAPNENAVIERSFRTDEEEFFWRMEAIPKDTEELNRRYQSYLQLYNTYRPHLGIDLQTPQEKLESFQSVQ